MNGRINGWFVVGRGRERLRIFVDPFAGWWMRIDIIRRQPRLPRLDFRPLVNLPRAPIPSLVVVIVAGVMSRMRSFPSLLPVINLHMTVTSLARISSHVLRWCVAVRVVSRVRRMKVRVIHNWGHPWVVVLALPPPPLSTSVCRVHGCRTISMQPLV